MKEIARNIGEHQRACGMKEPVEQFVEQFKFGLAEVVYEWACGKVFKKYASKISMHTINP